MCCSGATECQELYCTDCGGEEEDNYAKLDAVLASLGAAAQPADMDTYTERVPSYDALLETVHGGPHLHFGALATWRMLKDQCVGHGIPLAYVKFYIRECGVCQKYRRTLTNDRIPHVIRHLKVPGPRSTIGIDGFTMTPPDKHGHSYMHVLVNHFTKHVFLFPSKLKNAEGAANAIITYISMFGRFSRVMTDPGSDYGSDVVAQLNAYFGTAHAFSLVDRHESNGVEAVNRELKRHIQSLVHDKRFADRWSEPQVLGVITYHINNQPSSESGFSAFDCTFGSMQSDFFRSMDLESADMAPDSKFVQELTLDIAAVQEKSREFQQLLVATRATDLSKPRNRWVEGDFVFIDNLAPLNKLQAPRLGPYEVVSHYRNDVTLRDLISKATKDFHVDRLSLFSGSASEAFDLAMRDRDQHLVERFLAYRGDVNKRQTLEFLISYTDDQTPVWRRYEPDVSDTAAFESYCKSLPQLEPLLSTAAQAQSRRSDLLRTRTDVAHLEGDVIFVDLRAREIYEHEWYNGLVMEAKDIVPRYARLCVGPASAPTRGITTGTRVDLLDSAFQLVHRVDAHFLHYNGTLRSVAELPEGSEVVTGAFSEAHPYIPVDQVKHRDMLPADRPLLAHTPIVPSDSAKTFRVLSYNVNGIASALRKGFLEQLRTMEDGPPEVLVMQETRAHMCTEGALEKRFEALGYRYFKMVAGALPGQGGVAVASQTPFEILSNGSGVETGHGMAIRVEGYTVAIVYAPIVCSFQDRMIVRREEFDGSALAWIAGLPEPILVAGDLNCAPDPLRDIRIHPRPTGDMVLFTSDVETNFFRTLVSKGYLDCFRSLNPEQRAYTTFPQGDWRGVRARIDHIMASKVMSPNVVACRIHPHTLVSDHAGVEVVVRRPGVKLWFPFDKWSLTPPAPTPARYNLSWLNYIDYYQPASRVVTVGMVLIEPNRSPTPPLPLAAEQLVTDEQMIQAAEEAEELERAIALSLTPHVPSTEEEDTEDMARAIALSLTPISLEATFADIPAAAADEAARLFPDTFGSPQQPRSPLSPTLAQLYEAADAVDAAAQAARLLPDRSGPPQQSVPPQPPTEQELRNAADAAEAAEQGLPFPFYVRTGDDHTPAARRAADEAWRVRNVTRRLLQQRSKDLQFAAEWETIRDKKQQQWKEQRDFERLDFAMGQYLGRQVELLDAQRLRERQEWTTTRIPRGITLESPLLSQVSALTALTPYMDADLARDEADAQDDRPEPQPVAERPPTIAEEPPPLASQAGSPAELHDAAPQHVFTTPIRPRGAQAQPRLKLVNPLRGRPDVLPSPPLTPPPPVASEEQAAAERIARREAYDTWHVDNLEAYAREARRRHQPPPLPPASAPPANPQAKKKTMPRAAPAKPSSRSGGKGEKGSISPPPLTPPQKRFETLRHLPWRALTTTQQEMLLASTPSPLSSAPQSEEGKLTAAEWDNLHHPAPAAVERTQPRASDFNYRQACDSIDLDWAIPAVPQSSLRVGPSRYGFFLAGALSFTVGDALTATGDILPGQRIAQFVGTEISTEAAADLPDGLNNYLITISDETVLNCEDTARARPIPRCFASNANMAEGLHSAGVTLTIHDNNASADLSSDEQGRPIAWLYAVAFIAAGEEIMWSYGVEYAGGFDVSDDSDSDYEPPR